jgi:hypothetical protein
MKYFLLFTALSFYAKAQRDPCVVTTSYSLVYVSNNGSGNCTFSFTPTVTVNQSGASVKLAQYTFTVGSTTAQVCYSGNPVAIVPCSGTFNDLPGGANQVFPTATVVLPCNSGSLTLRGSTSTQGSNTCTTQTIFSSGLPVSLVSFYGSSKTNGIVLNWATEWEKDNQEFSIQKSRNATSFERIGTVEGQLNTSKVSGYEFTDTDVVAGQTYYYRLKQKDITGTEQNSKIISVRYLPGQDIPASVFPNANVGGTFTLSMPNADTALLKLYNEAGIEIPINIHKTGDRNQVSISVKNHAPAGLYFLKIVDTNGYEANALKVLVQQ